MGQNARLSFLHQFRFRGSAFSDFDFLVVGPLRAGRAAVVGDEYLKQRRQARDFSGMLGLQDFRIRAAGRWGAPAAGARAEFRLPTTLLEDEGAVDGMVNDRDVQQRLRPPAG